MSNICSVDLLIKAVWGSKIVDEQPTYHALTF